MSLGTGAAQASVLPPAPFALGVYEVKEVWDEFQVCWDSQPLRQGSQGQGEGALFASDR